MSELFEFELFKFLPKEIRRIVWREALENRLVVVAPRVDWLARRSRLPAMSAVHQESRKIFLGMYIRLISESTGMPHNTSSFDWLVKDHVYFNPDVDTLVLGTTVDRLGGFRFALASPQWHVKVDGLGDLTTLPIFPGYTKSDFEKLYYHNDATLRYEYLEGIRPNYRIPDDHFRVDPYDSCGIRIDISHDSNVDWITDA
ncbi:hypothetical protein CSIM01_04644 [Colletotrichum simmondsii]|uniref:2EXR domain-containing protein n=1 Tax=Colletotrichum simmondsii TaxID=703756 RepID=A0A135SGV2_9PEZI|nr:hypothetical protein CSIM01_04644 [Colletotrichum simmondsii]